MEIERCRWVYWTVSNINVSKLVKRKRIDYKRILKRMIIQTFEIEIAEQKKERERMKSNVSNPHHHEWLSTPVWNSKYTAFYYKISVCEKERDGPSVHGERDLAEIKIFLQKLNKCLIWDEARESVSNQKINRFC